MTDSPLRAAADIEDHDLEVVKDSSNLKAMQKAEVFMESPPYCQFGVASALLRTWS